MENQTHFGQWVKQRRKELRLTRKDLAQALDVSVVTIGKIELGERRPSMQVAELLVEHLNIPVAERESFIRFARGPRFDTFPHQEVRPTLQYDDIVWKLLARYPNNLPAQATR